MNTAQAVLVADLLELRDSTTAGAAFHVLPRRAGRRCLVASAESEILADSHGWWVTPRADVGDTPDKYHPKYVMAVLASKAAARMNRDGAGTMALPLPQWALPLIGFVTEEFTRRSMTLNGMRMTTEYFASGSPRVLQLIEQRLVAGQRDVVHDVLVYLMERVLQARAEAREARLWRAESVAAYLGLDQKRVNTLFLAPRLAAPQLAAALQAGAAGELRRAINIDALLESQVRHLQPVLRRHRRQECGVLQLIDEVAQRLYDDN